MRKLLLAIMIFVTQRTEAQMEKYYTNPILAGFYPDPSICRVDDDYYLVTSSFAYFPGLPLFHSRDLVNWENIGHAMDRPGQLDLSGAGVSRGLFAPAISYHNGVFYIVCTLIDKGGNFVITAKDPKGPWSDPVWLPEVEGIDPSLFFDADKAYIVYNSVPPDNKALWSGHRTIRMREFDFVNLKVSGEEILLVNGGTDITKKPVWIEAPHIYRINNWYYLLCAEGGTGYHHSEVVFRSRSVEGPYQPYEHNPILSQRQLDPLRKHPVTTAGHADMVDTRDGRWYAVFLACRPYEANHFNTGRETFLLPVTWKDEWPRILDSNSAIAFRYPLPFPQKTQRASEAFSGNFVYRDEFEKEALSHRWIFLRTPQESWHRTARGRLTIQLRPETVAGRGNPSFLGHRQQHLNFSAKTELDFYAASANEKAGLAIFQNEDHFYYLALSTSNGKSLVQLYQSVLLPADSSCMQLLAEQTLEKQQHLFLKISASGPELDFYFSTDGSKWQLLKGKVDARFLSTETAGGFVGCTIGPYATSLGKPSATQAHFLWFEYQGKDEMYD